MDWFRWWHGTVNDPKFQWVARKSGQCVGSVIAVWAALLEHASSATQCNADATRGNVASFDCSDFDVAFGFEDGVVSAIFEAMEQKGLIVDGAIAKWNERQPKREDSGNPFTGALSSTERSRIHREKKKREASQCNDMQRDATHGNDREDKSREEIKTKTARVALTVEDLVADGLTAETATDWLAFRKQKRAPLTQTAWNGLKAEAAKAGWSLEAVVTKCMARGWQGFEAAWVKDEKPDLPQQSRFAGLK
ncbi:hypothetical protein [Cupriavidus gilardii]|uniref:Uncharacterized protein n=1 Tax=Cupriavidus gilardii TaxID=82541 RepID=A0A849BK24_9BURK|nr:hypothetical protein [Cupriavidus gilardii]KAB0597767.1 hypothetical protein F7Q96_07555 [Cupriavidus gilardii]NNH14073.1 hypothetical protein [Cupriavidus gilardii]